MSESHFRIRLAPKNEGVEYVDDVDTYRFNASLRDGAWTVELPPSSLKQGSFTEDASAVIVPRIRAFLSKIRWFGVFPRTYLVEFVTGNAQPQKREYSIGFLPGRRGVRYRDEHGEYHFAAQRSSDVWRVKLPPFRGDGSPAHLTLEEKERILPRLSSYLSH